MNNTAEGLMAFCRDISFFVILGLCQGHRHCFTCAYWSCLPCCPVPLCLLHSTISHASEHFSNFKVVKCQSSELGKEVCVWYPVRWFILWKWFFYILNSFFFSFSVWLHIMFAGVCFWLCTSFQYEAGLDESGEPCFVLLSIIRPLVPNW